MFFAFLVAVGVVLALTLIGAMMARRHPDTEWERQEDRPLFGPGDHF